MRFCTPIRFMGLILSVALMLVPLAAQQPVALPLSSGLDAKDVASLVLSIKSIGGIAQVEASSSKSDVLVSGTPDQIKLAKWFVSVLDRPAGVPVPTNPTELEYRLPGETGQSVRIFCLAHAEVLEELQDIMMAIRSMDDIRFIYPYARQRALSMRGTASQIQLAAWLINQLDKPAEAQIPPADSPREYQLAGSGDLVRLFTISSVSAPKQLMEKLLAVRAATGMQRLCPVPKRNALVVRGRPEQMEIAQRVINQSH